MNAERFALELETLGLAAPARLADVKQRFRQLAKEFHPDRYQRASESARRRAEQIFVRVTAAYRAILAGTR
ncbi:MAG TPA: J domain-containing protein [Pirellulaceae bacterium]|nr:J domain-containing protein [Pirellulaceae bacterium]